VKIQVFLTQTNRSYYFICSISSGEPISEEANLDGESLETPITIMHAISGIWGHDLRKKVLKLWAGILNYFTFFLLLYYLSKYDCPIRVLLFWSILMLSIVKTHSSEARGQVLQSAHPNNMCGHYCELFTCCNSFSHCTTFLYWWKYWLSNQNKYIRSWLTEPWSSRVASHHIEAIAFIMLTHSVGVDMYHDITLWWHSWVAIKIKNDGCVHCIDSVHPRHWSHDISWPRKQTSSKSACHNKFSW